MIGGTQHVIANVAFLGIPLLLSLFHPAAPRAGISRGFGHDGLLTNIGITAVGNLIGGTLFVAAPELNVSRLTGDGAVTCGRLPPARSNQRSQRVPATALSGRG